MEIAEKDITQLLEGDKILVEVNFEDVYNGELIARYQTPSHGQLRIWIEPEKYRGVPIEPIVEGSQFKSSLTGTIVEVYLVKDGYYFCFLLNDPTRITILDDQTLLASNWDRVQ